MAPPSQISTNYSACRVILRESCSRHLGTPARGPCSNSFTGSRFSQRIIIKMALITFNMRSSEQPSYLHSLLENYTPSRNLRSEGQHLLRIPLRTSAAARRSFCFGAPTVWNSLDSKTREGDSLESFKTRLKTQLFSSAFQWSICSSSHSPLASESPSDNLFIVLGGQFIHCSWRNLASKSNSIIIINNNLLFNIQCLQWTMYSVGLDNLYHFLHWKHSITWNYIHWLEI